nr:stress response protein NST1-like [Lolium perenne]
MAIVAEDTQGSSVPESEVAGSHKSAASHEKEAESEATARKKAELAASEARAEADDAKAKAASVEELQQKLKDAESALLEQKSAQLIFDNYSTPPCSAAASPASSFSKKILVDPGLLKSSSSGRLSEDLQELRQQLQSMKKQNLAVMEQSRKASEGERLALRQAEEAVAARDAAVLEAKGATTREDSMLELMLEASSDMLGSVLDSAAEDQRVNERTNLLVDLSLNHGTLLYIAEVLYVVEAPEPD